MKREMRQIGQTTLKTAPLVFGGNVFGWTINEEMSFKLLDQFVENGFNMIDTADIYSNWVAGNVGGESETIIGNWMKKNNNRDKVLIATKVGMEMDSNKKGLSKAYIFKAVEDSLRRLQTDYIDLYQAHEDDFTIPMEETLSAFTELQKQGKIRFVGASNFTAERLAKALDISKQNRLISYQSLQPLYNLYDRADYEGELESLCLKNNMGVITYFSLASGFLTGKYHSKMDLEKSARRAIVEKYMNDRGLKILNALNKIAQELNATPAQVAIAWLTSHRSVTAPIVSATNSKQLQEILKAAELHLTPEAIGLLITKV